MGKTFNDLANIIFNGIIPKLEDNDGLVVFVKNRAKFERWLQVELCGILSYHFPTVIPEKDNIDIVLEEKNDDVVKDWAIELKTVNTSYGFNEVENKTRPITKNIDDIIEDIKKLRSTNYTNKAVLFVVFPVTHNHKKWNEIHLNKIVGELNGNIIFKEFKFKNKSPGVIYFGLVK